MAITYLLLSIVFSTSINLIFRWFKDFNVNKLQAILVNYLVCFAIGYTLSSDRALIANLSSEWFLYCLGLGIVFVAIFFSMALTTEKMGVSVTAVSGKMSVVIPILFAFVIAGEQLSLLFIIGVILSLLSIYFISVKKGLVIDKRYFFLPVIVFLGGGFIDTSLKILETAYSDQVSMDTISYSIFLGAFIAGFVIFTIKNKGVFSTFERKSLLAGVGLGIPNYFSIVFLLNAIAGFSDNSARVFGLNNIGVVILSTVLSVLLFKEKLSTGNKVGLVLALLSIVIIAYAS
ncbi:MAG: EamA/RhaT family transporter [Bacteroidetes bacterium]|jgi:drug/metabolite transporter (DMT)-like permease|nr:EamA/RhaT family transporter [Bacteroidota bacterium]